MDILDRIHISPEMLRLLAQLDEFKGMWRGLGQTAPDRLSALRRVATIESIGSSTRIEGAQLSDDEVEHMLAHVGTQSFRSRDEQEVAGYADAMEMVFASWREIALTENHIKQLHTVLLRHAARDGHHRGEYKKLPNHIKAFDQEGNSLGVVIEFATPFDTPRLMQQLVTRSRAALDANEHHTLLIVAVFVVRLLAIHPFLDGNGRLSRVLTSLLLLRGGYQHVPYSSLEKVIEQNKDAYYQALRRAQASMDGEGLTDWILFFLRCLVAQQDALASKLEEQRLLEALPPLAEEMVRLARDHGRLTIREAVALTGGNRNTIKVHLRRLVEQGKLRRAGRGRGTWYVPG